MTYKNYPLSIRLTAVQRKTVLRRAKARGLKVAEYIRFCIAMEETLVMASCKLPGWVEGVQAANQKRRIRNELSQLQKGKKELKNRA